MHNRIAFRFSSKALSGVLRMTAFGAAVAAVTAFTAATKLQADPFFVDLEAPAGGDGLSWGTAFDSLPAAVEAAAGEISAQGGAAGGATAAIWVKGGEYELTEALAWERGFSGIQLIGGFAGTESDPGERSDIHGENATILRQTTPGERVLSLDVPLDELVHVQFAAAGTVTVSWESVVGELYYVQYGASTDGPWETVTDLIEATDTTTEVVLTDAEEGFYRVMLRLADPVQRNVRVDGLTLTGARDVDGHGGALIIRQALPSVVIANCRITDNSTLEGGGGVYVVGNSTYPSRPMFLNTEITNNLTQGTADLEGGGGILYTSYAGGTIQDTVISGNRVEGPRGGGILMLGSATDPLLLLNRTRVSNNSSSLGGGAIFTNAPVTIRQSILSGNTVRQVTSEGWGGGALFTWSPESNIVLDRTIVSGNQLTGDAGRAGGGGIQFRTAGTISVTNSIISGNQVLGTVQTRGAAVYFRQSNEGATMANNTIAENFIERTAGSDGGTVNIRDGSISFANNLFTLNNDTGINVWHQGASEEFSNLYFGNENRGEDDEPAGDPRFVSEGENAVTGTWADIGSFESHALTGRGVTLLIADGTPFAGLSLAGTLVNPNTDQMRQALILSNTDSELLVEGDIAEEYDASEGGSFKLIDYRIEENSEAIGVADPAWAPGWDFAVNKRPQGAAPDIGAFELFEGDLFEGDLNVASFNRISPAELELVFSTPFPPEAHTIEHRSDLVAGDWDEQTEAVITPLGTNLMGARIPMGAENREFYRVLATWDQGDNNGE